MKLPPGTRTLTITTGGVTTVTVQVPAAQSPVSLGTNVYHWDAAKGVYWSDAGPSWFDPDPSGSLTGATGTPPNVHAFIGTWA